METGEAWGGGGIAENHGDNKGNLLCICKAGTVLYYSGSNYGTEDLWDNRVLPQVVQVVAPVSEILGIIDRNYLFSVTTK